MSGPDPALLAEEDRRWTELHGTTPEEALEGETIDRELAQERPERPETDEVLDIVDDVRRMRDELVMTLARVDAILAEREDEDRLIVVDEPRSDAHTL